MWIQRNYKTIIRISYLIPILLCAAISIGHVSSWYDITNPLNWAIYLSIGVEVAALSALAGITAKMNKWVYLPFIIVTFIQFIGNVFFSFQYIDMNSQMFKDWVAMVNPLFQHLSLVTDGNLMSHRIILATLAGGLIPIISLSFLHLLVSFNDKHADDEIKSAGLSKKPIVNNDIKIEKIEEPVDLVIVPSEMLRSDKIYEGPKYEIKTPLTPELKEKIKDLSPEEVKELVISELVLKPSDEPIIENKVDISEPILDAPESLKIANTTILPEDIFEPEIDTYKSIEIPEPNHIPDINEVEDIRLESPDENNEEITAKADINDLDDEYLDEINENTDNITALAEINDDDVEIDKAILNETPVIEEIHLESPDVPQPENIADVPIKIVEIKPELMVEPSRAPVIPNGHIDRNSIRGVIYRKQKPRNQIGTNKFTSDDNNQLIYKK
jgi:hypothetical protein